MLPEQVEIIVDFHLRPYYGDEDEPEDLYYSEAKHGTTAFHPYATLYARVKNKRYTLAVRRVAADSTPVTSCCLLGGMLTSQIHR
jgi:hypothetical protein